jgi:hypothetical protein
MEKTISDALAASRGLFAHFIPSSISEVAFSRVRFQPVTMRPAAMRRDTIPAPIAPSPIKLILMVQLLRSFIQKEGYIQSLKFLKIFRY